MPVKRPVDDDDDRGEHGAHHHLPPKVSRHDLHVDYDHPHGNSSQSASARKKGVSNRTGQACDRCKVRIQALSIYPYTHTHTRTSHCITR